MSTNNVIPGKAGQDKHFPKQTKAEDVHHQPCLTRNAKDVLQAEMKGFN